METDLFCSVEWKQERELKFQLVEVYRPMQLTCKDLLKIVSMFILETVTHIYYAAKAYK